MKILAVTTKSPYPLNEGRALRTYNLLREAARSHDVRLCTYVQSEAELLGVERMREFCAEVHAIPLYLRWPRLELAADLLRDLWSSAPVLATKYLKPEMAALIAAIADRSGADVLHLDMLHLWELAAAAPQLPVVLVEHNVESALFERRVEHAPSLPMRRFLERQLRKLRRYEIAACQSADWVATVSEADAVLIRELAHSSRVSVVPNSVDTEFFRPSNAPRDDAHLVYVGGLSWTPNLDAIEYFSTRILPLIRERVPNVTLTVVGEIPNARVAARCLSGSGVTLTGLVNDIRPIVSRATAFVVPLRIGGGTRLKILDALAMGKAVVSTSIGCEGLKLQHEREILVADDPERFAAQVLRVIEDPALAERLGKAGRRCVEEHYQWTAAAELMQEVYERAIAHRATRRPGTCVA